MWKCRICSHENEDSIIICTDCGNHKGEFDFISEENLEAHGIPSSVIQDGEEEEDN
jgi:hypothetical protein